MNKVLSALAATLALCCFSAHAVETASCDARAAEKKLAGAAKTSFLKKCNADNPGAGNACDAQAAEKKLAGAAKTSFLKKCNADAGAPAAASPEAACEAKSAEKKLAGAAKTSFVKKCVADAAAK